MFDIHLSLCLCEYIKKAKKAYRKLNYLLILIPFLELYIDYLIFAQYLPICTCVINHNLCQIKRIVLNFNKDIYNIIHNLTFRNLCRRKPASRASNAKRRAPATVPAIIAVLSESVNDIPESFIFSQN